MIEVKPVKRIKTQRLQTSNDYSDGLDKDYNEYRDSIDKYKRVEKKLSDSLLALELEIEQHKQPNVKQNSFKTERQTSYILKSVSFEKPKQVEADPLSRSPIAHSMSKREFFYRD